MVEVRELAARWIDQRDPFHRSTSGSPAPTPPGEAPTAVHIAAEMHSTPLSCSPPLGVGWTDHVAPFHRSASVDSLESFLELKLSPTAVQVVRDVHETSLNAGEESPLVGVGSTDHLDPFHRSASGSSPTASFARGLYPTAMHAVDDAHDTPKNPPTVTPLGFAAEQPARPAATTTRPHSPEHKDQCQTTRPAAISLDLFTNPLSAADVAGRLRTASRRDGRDTDRRRQPGRLEIVAGRRHSRAPEVLPRRR
jgi:hypothetical protein